MSPPGPLAAGASGRMSATARDKHPSAEPPLPIAQYHLSRRRSPVTLAIVLTNELFRPRLVGFFNSGFQSCPSKIHSTNTCMAPRHLRHIPFLKAKITHQGFADFLAHHWIWPKTDPHESTF